MGDEEHVILREQFPVYPGKTKFDVSVTSTKIITGGLDRSGRDKNEDIIMMDDVIGCHVLQDKKNTVTAAYLCIFSYPLKKKRIGSGVFRQRVTKTFTIDSRKTYQENLVVAETWKMTIKRLVTGEKIRTKEDIENGSLATRNLLVLINPFSGKKKATTLYKEKVKPMFREAEIKHTVQKTDHPGHAKEIAKQLKLKDWDGIVIISGDGLVHEVINGLMDRPDWKEAIKMPIGIVPGGSGNALAAAIVYASTGQILSSNLELDAMFEILRGKTRRMSLAAIETEAGQRYYSFLNFAWGFIADVDIESERFRKLGPVRFAIGCAIRVANMRLYHGRISYLPATRSAYSFGRSQSCIDNRISEDYEDIPSPSGKSSSLSFDPRRVFKSKSVNEDAIHNDIDLIGATMKRRLSNGSDNDAFENGLEPGAGNDLTISNGIASDQDQQASTSTDSLPEATTSDAESEKPDSVHDGGGDINENNSAKLVKTNGSEKTESGESGPVAPVIHQNGKEAELEPPIAWKESAIVYHLQASCDSPPPDDWIHLESEYIWVTSVYLSHLGNEMMGVPQAKLDDDILFIYTLRKGISKAQMVNVLLGFEGGTHIERGGEFSTVIPCRAVRLEPLNFITGHMTVDGELVPHSSIQASITPHKIPIMSSVSD